MDKTIFGRNVTSVSTDGEEVEHVSRTKKKPFMLSAKTEGPSSLTLNCRLISRGPGWHTRQERFVMEDGQNLMERHVLVRPGHTDIVVDRVFCRLQAGDAVAEEQYSE